MVFAVLWQSVPKLSSLRGEGWDIRVLLYVLQGISYPIVSGIGRVTASTDTQAFVLVGVVSAAVLGWLAMALWRGRRTDVLLVGLAFLVPNALLLWKELGYEYASVASRVLYPGAPGAALLWGTLISLPIGYGRWRRLWIVLCLLLILIMNAQSVLTIADLNRLYDVGARHMDRLVDVSSQPDQHLLFVNFPDRLALRSPDYPLGYWGLILAPVSVNLGEYARLVRGVGADTYSLSSVYMAANLDRWPYQVDIRGVIASTQDLRQAVLWADHTYLTEYQPDGTLVLKEASMLSGASTDDGPLAVWLDADANAVAYLQSAKVDFARGLPGLRTSDMRFPPVQGELVVVLVWECVRTAHPQDTVFVHLYGPQGGLPLDIYDSDPVLRLLPMASWQPGDIVRDVRYLDVSEIADLNDTVIGVGVYNRLKNERLAVTDAQGYLLTENTFFYPLRLEQAGQ